MSCLYCGTADAPVCCSICGVATYCKEACATLDFADRHRDECARMRCLRSLGGESRAAAAHALVGARGQRPIGDAISDKGKLTPAGAAAVIFDVDATMIPSSLMKAGYSPSNPLVQPSEFTIELIKWLVAHRIPIGIATYGKKDYVMEMLRGAFGDNNPFPDGAIKTPGTISDPAKRWEEAYYPPFGVHGKTVMIKDILAFYKLDAKPADVVFFDDNEKNVREVGADGFAAVYVTQGLGSDSGLRPDLFDFDVVGSTKNIAGASAADFDSLFAYYVKYGVYWRIGPKTRARAAETFEEMPEPGGVFTRGLAEPGPAGPKQGSVFTRDLAKSSAQRDPGGDLPSWVRETEYDSDDA